MATAGEITPPLTEDASAVESSTPLLAAEATLSATEITANASLSAAAAFREERQQHLTLTSDHPSTISEPERSESLPPPAPKPAPLFINSIGDLKDLSAAIASFRQCYEDLHYHLNSIKTAMLSKFLPETPHATPNPDISEPATSPAPDVSVGIVLQKQQELNLLNSELEGLCKTMYSRGVRKYLITHLPNIAQLREEVPKALKLAPKPQKLVLECLGKFYLQGSRAFTTNSAMILARDASIFVLECFLLMMGKENGVLSVEKAERVEAEQAALAWRKRMVADGGLAQANQLDARGLLLFVASFGIPNSFTRDDMWDLLVAANSKEVAGVLRMSQVLMKKISEIVEGMLKHKREVDAVDLIYTFGLEERFDPQNILVSCLQKSKEYWKNPPRKGSQSSAAALNEANKTQLSTLQSISKCLERHSIDPAQLLPGWQINEKIATLYKDISISNKNPEDRGAHKRKSGENNKLPIKPKSYESKRPHYDMSHCPQHHRSDSQTNTTGHQSSDKIYRPPMPVFYGVPGTGSLPKSMAPPHGTNQYAGGLHSGAKPYAWLMEERYGQSSSEADVGPASGGEGFGEWILVCLVMLSICNYYSSFLFIQIFNILDVRWDLNMKQGFPAAEVCCMGGSGSLKSLPLTVQYLRKCISLEVRQK